MRRALVGIVLAALATLVLAGAAQADSELPDVGCPQEHRLRSVDCPTATEVIFFNQSPAPIRAYWLDYDGERVFRSEIRPGDSFVQQIYVTHPGSSPRVRQRAASASFSPYRTH